MGERGTGGRPGRSRSPPPGYLYSERDVRTPLNATIVNGAVWVALTAVLLGPMGVAGGGVAWMVRVVDGGGDLRPGAAAARARRRSSASSSCRSRSAFAAAARIRAAAAARERARRRDHDGRRRARRLPGAQPGLQPPRPTGDHPTDAGAAMSAPAQPAAGRLVPAPMFLVGSERSGTTLLRLMLDHHPEIAFEKEFDFVVQRCRTPASPAAQQYRRVARHRAWRGLRDRPVAGIPRARERLPAPEAGRLRRQTARRRDHPPQLRPPPLPVAGRPLHPPRARSRATWPGRSCRRGGLGTSTRPPSSGRRPSTAGTRSPRTSRRTSPSRSTTRSWCCDRRPSWPRSAGSSESTTPRRCSTTRVDAPQYPPPDPALVAQWRTKLPPRDVGLVELRTAGLMGRRGYAPSGHPLPAVGPVRHELLLTAARLRNVRTRLDVFGPWLVTTDVLGRRLGMRRLARYAKQGSTPWSRA